MQKSVLKSKTFYFGLLTAISPLIPGVSAFMAANAEMIGMIWGAAAILIRFITKDKIVLVD